MFIFLFVVSSAYAATSALSLNYVFNPFQGLDIAGFYQRYYQFIDAIIYLMLFISLAQYAFAKVYKMPDGKPSREGKMIAVAIGLALMVSMVVLESNTGWYLGKLVPVALLVFLLMLAILLYNLLLGLFDGDNKKSVSGSLTYLIIYGLLVVPFGTLYQWIAQNVPILSGLLGLASVAAFIYLVIQMFLLFRNNNPQQQIPGPHGPIGPQGPQGLGGQLGPGGPQGNVGGGGVGVNNNNTLHVTSPQAYHHYLPRQQIALTFNVEGAGFANGFDYVVMLNNDEYTGRVQNAAGPTVNCPALNNINNHGAYVVEIIAYQHDTDTVIVRANCLFFIDNPQGLNQNILQLQQLSQALVHLATEYANLGIVIVQLHRGRIQGRQETEEVWLGFLELEHRLINGMHDFNTGMQAILNDPVYQNMSAQELELVYTAFQEFALMSNALLVYYNELVDSYNDHNQEIPHNPFQQQNGHN